ncbi:MAG: ZIP family metal transporter [Gammaproteobacteria bacterium]|jgi:zinc transporter, ZIP family
MDSELTRTAVVAVLVLSSLSIISMLLGVVLAIHTSRQRRTIALGMGFSVGIMLLVSFAELIPQALNDAGMAEVFAAVLAGMLVVAMLHWVIPHTHLFRETSGFGEGAQRRIALRSAYLVAFGLILHDVPEGFAMANSYIASASMGVLVALAIAIHNIPEEFAMALPIVTAKSRRFLYTAALLSGLAEPLGAVIGLVAVHYNPSLNAIFMAFAAGAMVFVSIHELIPMARRYGRPVLFTLGACSSLVVYLLLFLALPA